MNKRLFSATSFVLFLIAANVVGQQSPPATGTSAKEKPGAPQKEKEDVVRISVTLVQVDAVVTDEKGRYVTDLKPEDFEIFEDKRRQQITNFSYINTQPASGGVAGAAATSPSKSTTTPMPPARLSPDQVRRTIALVVDDLSMSFESIQFVRNSLKKFVDEQMQPGDLVAILRTGAGIGALQQFTSDKRLLYAAIERVRYNLMGSGHLSAFADITSDAPSDGGLGQEEFRRFQLESERSREQLFSVGTLGAINFVVRGLRDLPGRKSVILLSDGFQMFSQGGSNDRVLESVRCLVDLANRSSVIVYTIDARGLQTAGLTAADNVRFRGGAGVAQKVSDRRDQLFNSQGGLSYLANQTGGFFVRNTNDIPAGIGRALDDQKGYYLLGYIPDQSTFKVVQGKRQFHNITVKVKRAGLRVRSRTGFYGIPDEERHRGIDTPAQQIVTALTSPFASGGIRLKLTSLFGHEPQAGSFVRSMMHIDGRDITFGEEQDGRRSGELNIVAFTFGDNGQVIDREGRSYNLSVSSEQLQRLKDEGFVYVINVPVKKPGGYQLRVAVRDARSELVGSASQFIEVPDIDRNRLTLSGLVVSGYDPSRAKKTAAAETSGQATPQAASVKEGATDDFDPMTGPAVRMLRRGIDVDYGFLIYNAQLNPTTGQPQLETQVLLLKDGKKLFAGTVNPLNVGEQPDMKHIPATGRLRLSADLAPGEYVLQVVVVDKLAKDKYRSATQWMDFEVVK
jgi:VWFA-related protein